LDYDISFDNLSTEGKLAYNRIKANRVAMQALRDGVPRELLYAAAQAAYDRIKAEEQEEEFPEPNQDLARPRFSSRTQPEVRDRILGLFKATNSKYSKPFNKSRLAMLSIMGSNWEEYGQVVLQMAILNTLLSIEEKLDKIMNSPDTNSGSLRSVKPRAPEGP
jgi:hypothetical protein